jgi:hypothetical protein
VVTAVDEYEMGDILVYADPDGRHYVALIGEDWFRWPAKEGGWQRRERSSDTAAERCEELPLFNAWLALRLSGVRSGDV